MILFLDTVSPLPEFSLIEDNKIVYSNKIIKNDKLKMSDFILKAYLELEEFLFPSKKIEFLITNTGPGSYTSLRVGISFLSGLSLAYNIELIGVSCLDLINFSIENSKKKFTAIHIQSANDQNFMFLYDNNKRSYNISKIEKNNLNFLLQYSNLREIFTNNKQMFIKFNKLQDIRFKDIMFKELLNKNLIKILSIPRSKIIEPIYISNNEILN